MANFKANFDSYKATLEKKLYEKNAFTDLLAVAEKKTKVDRVKLVLGLHAVVALYLALGYGAQFISSFIGFLYPAYASLKAIESKQKDDDTKWLTYWVVYASFSLIEFFADIFLFWIPFYWLLKCALYIYMMAPIENNGSVVIYNRVLKPFILKYESKIDSAIDRAKNTAKSAAEEAKDLAGDAMVDGAASSFSKMD